MRILESVDGGDVRVIERRQHLRFAREARQPLGIGGERLRQDLERDLAIEPRVARAVHLAHAACTEQRHDLEGAETCSSGECHYSLPVNGEAACTALPATSVSTDSIFRIVCSGTVR